MHNGATDTSGADDPNFRAAILPVMRGTRSSGSQAFRIGDHATRQIHARAATYNVVCSALQWGRVLCIHRVAQFAVRSEEIKKPEPPDEKCWAPRRLGSDVRSVRTTDRNEDLLPQRNFPKKSGGGRQRFLYGTSPVR